MNICQTKVLKVIKMNTMKRPIIIVGHTYNFTDKIKCYFNTNNTYYTYNQTLSKLSLMSPTSYQTALSRDIKFSIGKTLPTIILLNINIKNQVAEFFSFLGIYLQLIVGKIVGMMIFSKILTTSMKIVE